MLYITGLNGSAEGVIGSVLKEQFSDSFHSVSVNSKFNDKPFEERIEIVRNALWKENEICVANSQGAYLLLHALMRYEIDFDKLVLVSPILGLSLNENGGGRFPPFFSRFRAGIRNRSIYFPKHCKMLVGKKDHTFSKSGLEALQTAFPNKIEVSYFDCGHEFNASVVLEEIRGF